MFSFHNLPALHDVFMGGALFALVIGFGLLLFFALRRYDIAPGALLARGARYDARLEHSGITRLNGGYVIVADISGYSMFLSRSGDRADRAHHIVLQLLHDVADAVDGQLQLVKIEGDAALFLRKGGQEDVTTSQARLCETVEQMLSAFYRRRAQLVQSLEHAGAAAQRLAELNLKIVIDRGDIGLFTVNRRLDVSGLPVIRAFRLLKAEPGERAYLIITAAAMGEWGDTIMGREPQRRVYSPEGLAPVEACFVGLGAEV